MSFDFFWPFKANFILFLVSVFLFALASANPKAAPYPKAGPFRRSPQTAAQDCTVACQNKYTECISGTTSYGYNDVSAQNECQVKVTKCYAHCNKKDNTYATY
ncbi:13105_t:CDS:2 [Dentiscutata erythropus]|uniref:13105_t:CDS:1 n=1 Tax=Dentiscutata erythropus TaxID=1348616 RepID=A0A9N8VHU4_9GLOM|nr:13105_t:CDS:2 [Dentiscutata erythropus]